MDNTELAERIANADAEASAYAKNLLVETNGKDAKVELRGDQFAAMWKGAFCAIMKGNTSAGVEMFSSLMKSQNFIEASNMHETLFLVMCKPSSEKAYSSLISTAAAVARLNSGRIPEGVDKDWYIKTAGLTFIAVLETGSDISKRYAAELAANVGSEGVLATLAEVALRDKNPSVRKAAKETIERCRVSEELETARDDRGYLLDRYDPTSANVLFIDMTYDAIETILRLKKGDVEDAAVVSSAHQLASFAKNPERLEALFSTHQDLETVRWSVENALLHALKTGSQNLKGKAINGLARIGSDRVRSELESIILREMPGSDASMAAVEARTRIAGEQREDVHVLPPIKQVRKAELARVILPRKLTRQ